jgi:hypothetical protein
MFSKIALFGQFLKGFNFLSAFADVACHAKRLLTNHNQHAYAHHDGLIGHRCKAG